MAKDPSVLFYTQDFLVGTSFFTPAQRGHYITLLCHQHQSSTGTLTLEKVKALMGKDFDKNWPVVKQKFNEDAAGFYNERMKNETEKRKKYSESRRTNRQSSKEDMTDISKSYDRHMENENENSIEYKNGVVEKPKYWDSEKSSFLNAGDWIFTFCRSKKLTVDQFDAIAKDFVNDLELKQEYKSLKEIRSHFTNWFNKDKVRILAGLAEQKNGTSVREIQEKINREKLGLNG